MFAYLCPDETELFCKMILLSMILPKQSHPRVRFVVFFAANVPARFV